MTLRVTVFLPDRAGVEHELAEGGRYRAGRSPESDIVIADERVSREHVEFDGTGADWRLRDLNSKNGVRVDGRPVAGAVVTAALWISIGGVPALAERAGRRHARAAPVVVPAGPDPASVIDGALAAFRDVAQCERAALWLLDPHREPRLARLAGDAEPPPSLGVVARVATSGDAVVCSDVAGAAAIAQRASVAGGGLRAIVALPVNDIGGTVGVLYADSRVPGRVFTEFDTELLAGLGGQLAVALAAARLHAATRKAYCRT